MRVPHADGTRDGIAEGVDDRGALRVRHGDAIAHLRQRRGLGARAMKLLIDLGNTRLKCALWDGSALRFLGALPHAGADGQVDFAYFVERCRHRVGDPDRLGRRRRARRSASGARLHRAVRRRSAEFVAQPSRRPAACATPTPQPDRLGVDRFLGLVALHAVEPGPCVLASCGTALTLDALAADGSHLGGLIAPSPPLMRDALTGATARLSTPQAARVVERADNTGDAIESGVWLAGAALLERFVAHATATIRRRAFASCSPAAAPQRLAALIEPAHRIDAELVLRGLAIYAASRP